MTFRDQPLTCENAELVPLTISRRNGEDEVQIDITSIMGGDKGARPRMTPASDWHSAPTHARVRPLASAHNRTYPAFGRTCLDGYLTVSDTFRCLTPPARTLPAPHDCAGFTS